MGVMFTIIVAIFVLAVLAVVAYAFIEATPISPQGQPLPRSPHARALGQPAPVAVSP